MVASVYAPKNGPIKKLVTFPFRDRLITVTTRNNDCFSIAHFRVVSEKDRDLCLEYDDANYFRGRYNLSLLIGIQR